MVLVSKGWAALLKKLSCLSFPRRHGDTNVAIHKLKKNENCIALIPKGNSYCRRKSSARGLRFKVSSEGLSAEIVLGIYMIVRNDMTTFVQSYIYSYVRVCVCIWYTCMFVSVSGLYMCVCLSVWPCVCPSGYRDVSWTSWNCSFSIFFSNSNQSWFWPNEIQWTLEVNFTDVWLSLSYYCESFS